MRSIVFAIAFLGSVPAGFASPKDVPSWVQDVISRPTPTYPGRVPAVVLLSEQHVVVDASGTMTTTTREAIKILTRQGQDDARVHEYYFKGRTIKRLNAWLVAPNGFVKTYDKNSVSDIGAHADFELYNDIRVRRIAADNPETGAVFAYESEVEVKSLFAQDDYDFQNYLPVVQSRYVLTLPAGWTANSVILNHEPVQPIVEGSTYTWELKDLPFRESEEHGPKPSGLVPRLAINFQPPGAGSSGAVTCFRNWTDVSVWQSSLAAGQDETTPAIEQKVRELTANTSDEYAKIRAIARFVQKVKYVAIEMDTSHGGGYKPHSADSVFSHQYGDCKDKANLMRAMLKAAGIQSYLVAIWSGDRTFVREEWPSCRQFNHMILAVRLTAPSSSPAVLVHPVLGKLLIFDPTSESTPLGDVPFYEQSSFALLCAGSQGGLIKIPQSPASDNAVDINIDASLGATGELTASFASMRTGHPADIQRELRLSESDTEFRARTERQLAQSVKGPAIDTLKLEDSFDDNKFGLKVAFKSHEYGQLMQDRMLVFTPGILQPMGPQFTKNPNRTAPIVLNAATYRKHVKIQLPAGFTLDDAPRSADSDSPFAHFTLSFRQESNNLIMDEELTTQPVTLPADQYSTVKKFFDLFDGADQQRALLLKTGA